MKNTVEMQLRKLALGLTAAIVLLAIWSGIRVAILDEPAAIAPADSALRVSAIAVDEALADPADSQLVTRPMFWQGRKQHDPVAGPKKAARQVEVVRDSTIDEVELLGVYSAGDSSGLIISHQGERSRLRLNESVGGWTFTMLSPDGALFENNGESRSLNLEHAESEPRAGEAKAERRKDGVRSLSATRKPRKKESSGESSSKDNDEKGE